jgi:uncharacterized protein (DUF1499 family)
MRLGMKRTEIMTDTNSDVHAEFTSAIWQFIDDVEFYLEQNVNAMHIWSASGLGTYDFGVNWKYVETIQRL